MPSNAPVPGVNDLASQYPLVAAEADGWDPQTVTAGSGIKRAWKCRHGHTWSASPGSRTGSGTGCPYCANLRVWVGFNDLKTHHPDIANQADNWDPETVVSGSNKKKDWICQLGHQWQAQVSQRTARGSGCPYCAGQKVLAGFNDLKTRYPEIAKEADGWDPSKSCLFPTKLNPENARKDTNGKLLLVSDLQAVDVLSARRQGLKEIKRHGFI